MNQDLEGLTLEELLPLFIDRSIQKLKLYGMEQYTKSVSLRETEYPYTRHALLTGKTIIPYGNVSISDCIKNLFAEDIEDDEMFRQMLIRFIKSADKILDLGKT